MVGQKFDLRLRLLGLVAILGLLTGCASAQAPDRDPAVPSTSHGSPVASAPADDPTAEEATPEADSDPEATVDRGPLAAVTQLVIRPASLELRDANDQLVDALDYMGQVDEAVAALTAVFGLPPTDTGYEGDERSPDGVVHQWETFQLDERFYDESRRAAENHDYLVWPRFAVFFDGPVAHGIDLVTVQGHRAGDDWDGIISEIDQNRGAAPCSPQSIEAMDFVTPAGETDTVVVQVIQDWEDGKSGPIGNFYAPLLMSDFVAGFCP